MAYFDREEGERGGGVTAVEEVSYAAQIAK